jgi:hypothetical protein
MINSWRPGSVGILTFGFELSVIDAWSWNFAWSDRIVAMVTAGVDKCLCHAEDNFGEQWTYMWSLQFPWFAADGRWTWFALAMQLANVHLGDLQGGGKGPNHDLIFPFMILSPFIIQMRWDRPLFKKRTYLRWRLRMRGQNGLWMSALI